MKNLDGPKELSGMEKDIWKRKMSFIPRPVLIVTTVSKEGFPDAGLKTNFTIVSSLNMNRVAFVCYKFVCYKFVCYKNHDTFKNIVDTREFVVNIPTEEIINQTFMTAIPFSHNVNETEKPGLTVVPSEKVKPSKKVKPSRIKECKAHFECVLYWWKEIDHSVMVVGKMVVGKMVVGKMVAASADEDVIKGKELKIMLTSGSEGYGLIGKGKIKKFPEIIKEAGK